MRFWIRWVKETPRALDGNGDVNDGKYHDDNDDDVYDNDGIGVDDDEDSIIMMII